MVDWRIRRSRTALMEETTLITTLAIVLGVALVVGMVARLVGLPLIIGYLLSGMAIGPFGFALVRDAEQVQTLAEIGVVLLMFTLGIEFSMKTLRQTGRVAILGGVGQILITIALGVGVGLLLDWSLTEALLLGFFIALSSTIIVLKTLMDRGELGSPHGRVMIGILLVQDLSVVPMMVVVTSLGDDSGGALGALGWTVLKAAGFLVVLLALGHWAVPRLMRRVAGVRVRELFLLAIICICFGAAFGAYYVGLSIALGAFLAGLLVSGSDYAQQALADIRPLRDLFAVVFFVSLGMLADPMFISDNTVDITVVVAAIIVGKFLIASLVPIVFRYSTKTTLFVGSGLFQIGEFSFVLAAMALDLELITENMYSLVLSAALITILLTPFSMGAATILYNRAVQSGRLSGVLAGRPDPETQATAEQLANHVVICGYGDVGRHLGRVLDRRGFSYLIIDIDPRVVEQARDRNVPCVYGDASNPDILARVNLVKARVLVVTFPDPTAARLVVANARSMNPRLDIVARVHRDEDSLILRKLGVAEMVRPELEAGLEIIRHTLHRFGLTTQEILYIVNTLRDEEA